MNAIKVLTKARELLAVPERWTKRAEARNTKRREVYWSSEDAVCWCLAGAISKISPSMRDAWRAEDALDAVAPPAPRSSERPYIAFNDRRSTTHADILALLDRAIAKARGDS